MNTLDLRNFIDCKLTHPQTGAWLLQGVIDLETVLSGAVTVTIDSLSLVGTVLKAGVYGGVQTVRIIGGAGKLGELVKPRGYENASKKQVAEDICAVGEALSATSELAGTLPFYTQAQQTAGAALDALLWQLGDDYNWRMLEDGTVWIGKESWPSVSLDHVVTYEDPARDVLKLGSDYPTLLPGKTLDGRKIGRVVHRVSDAEILTEAWTV